MHFYINLTFRKLVNTYFQKWPLQFMTKIYYYLSRNIKVRKFTMFIAAVCVLPFSKATMAQEQKSLAHNSLCWVANVFQHSKKCRISARPCNVIYFFYILQSSKKLLEMAHNMLPLVNRIKKTLIYRAWRRHPLPIMGVSAGGSVEENITSGTFLCLLIKIRVQ